MHRLTETGVLAQRNFGKERYRVFEAVGVLDLFTYLERSLASPTGETPERGMISQRLSFFGGLEEAAITTSIPAHATPRNEKRGPGGLLLDFVAGVGFEPTTFGL